MVNARCYPMSGAFTVRLCCDPARLQMLTATSMGHQQCGVCACNNTAAGRLQVDAALEKKVEMKDVVRREFARSIGAEQVECAPTPPSALSCTHEPCVCVVCAAAKATKTALSCADHTQPRVFRGGNSLRALWRFCVATPDGEACGGAGR